MDTLPEMRWHVVVKKRRQHNDRFDIWEDVERKAAPVLQYKQGDKWVDVPVEETVDLLE